jgi:thymidylate synthase
MHVIQAENVNDAWARAVPLLLHLGKRERSRAGDVLVTPTPVTTVYAYPRERVLWDPVRDANPFFHLFEALWMLAGREDTEFLSRFVRDFGERFGESDGRLHGAYGRRWRTALGFDQLDYVVNKLRRDPTTRQCVIQMWDADGDTLGGSDDLRGDWKDRPCNTHVYLRVREELAAVVDLGSGNVRYLDMTVCCRSNDIVWGAYGANAVHFSMLLEYLAARCRMRVGRLYQISNNWHAYEDVLRPYVDATEDVGRSPDLYSEFLIKRAARVVEMVKDPEQWDRDLRCFMEWCETEEPDEQPQEYPSNPWFHEVAEPMFVAHMRHRAGLLEEAQEVLDFMVRSPDGVPCDWSLAGQKWIGRRLARRAAKEVTREA